MNIIFVIVACIATVCIFGVPIWNLARLQGKKHLLWMLVPPILFFSSFGLAQVFEAHQIEFWYQLARSIAFYWLIIGTMLFALSVVVTLFELAFNIPKKIVFWIIISLTLAYTAVAYINGHRIVVEDVPLPAQNITREYQFVHITDLHSGSTDRKHAQNVVNVIAELNPEFVVITGDFIDEFFVETTDIDPFNDLTMPVYLITGNHEYYLDNGKINDVIEGTKIQLIDDMKIPFEELDIVGVNELATVQSTLGAVGGIDDTRYTILLDHQPITEEVKQAEQSGVQLMLSGHTHKGQIWPMEFLIKLRFIYVAGLYRIGDMFLYVNQGTGTLGPMMRVGTANEVTHIRLIPSE